MAAEGLKLLPETREPTAAKPTHHHPPPGCSHRENSLLIGLSEPNPLPKIQIGPPCRANAAAQKLLQLQLKPHRIKFSSAKLNAEPEPRAEPHHVIPTHQSKALTSARTLAKPHPKPHPKSHPKSYPKPTQQAQPLGLRIPIHHPV